MSQIYAYFYHAFKLLYVNPIRDFIFSRLPRQIYFELRKKQSRLIVSQKQQFTQKVKHSYY